jgi:hypothetical protein
MNPLNRILLELDIGEDKVTKNTFNQFWDLFTKGEQRITLKAAARRTIDREPTGNEFTKEEISDLIQRACDSLSAEYQHYVGHAKLRMVVKAVAEQILFLHDPDTIHEKLPKYLAQTRKFLEEETV